MTIQTTLSATLVAADTAFTATTATALLTAGANEDIWVDSILYASAAGDTLTLDTYDGSTALRLRQVVIAANADGVFSSPFKLQRGHSLRATLATGNATAIRVQYTILK